MNVEQRQTTKLHRNDDGRVWVLEKRTKECITVPPRQPYVATADQQLDYSNKLLKSNFPFRQVMEGEDKGKIIKDQYVITMSTQTVRADQVKRMRVRQGKAGPNGKKRPTLDMLAKAENRYAFGKVEGLVPNEGFGKYGEQIISNKDIVTVKYDKNGKKIGKYDKDGNKIIYKPINGYTWEYTEHVNTVKKLRTVKSYAFARETILNSANAIIRQALLLKGIGFADIERDLKLAEGDYVSYLLNTVLEYDALRRNEAHLIRCYKLHKVTVKRTFREIENVMGQEVETCKVYFTGNSCRGLSEWLRSMSLDI